MRYKIPNFFIESFFCVTKILTTVNTDFVCIIHVGNLSVLMLQYILVLFYSIHVLVLVYLI